MNAKQNETGGIIDPEDELMSLRYAQEEALTGAGLENALTDFVWKPMPFDSAVAPLLTAPITPFESTDRKKAHTSALFYSECFLKGVTPTDADSAATDIQGRYKKWWVESGFHERDSNSVEGEAPGPEIGKENSPHSSGDMKQASGPSKRPRLVSESTQESRHRHRKRTKRRGGVRDVIQDHTVDPHEVPTDSESPHRRYLKTPSDVDSIRNIDDLSNVGLPQIEALRDELIHDLKASGGDTESPSFQSKLDILTSFYLSTKNDARTVHGNTPAYDLDGTWLTLSKPTYQNAKGQNGVGQYIYSLGGMSFDMFRPTGLICSIQGTFNTIHAIDPKTEELPVFVPRRLRKEVLRSVTQDEADGLRTYNIVVAFTIEPNQTRTGRQVPPSKGNNKQDEFVIRRPIRGIMTNYGYILPDPEVPNRLSIWFTGGALEVNDEQDLEEWKKIFDESTVPKRDMREFARLLAAKVLLGAHASDVVEPDGTMSYALKRPIGGHGSAFCDVLFQDDSLRIMLGHRGSLFVFLKVTSADDERIE